MSIFSTKPQPPLTVVTGRAAVYTNNPSKTWNGTLQECKFNNLPLVIESIETRFTQRIHEHKFPNVPGAIIEDLNVDPLSFKIKAQFYLNQPVRQGTTWAKVYGNLYPTGFNKVMYELAVADNESRTFIHPTLGSFQCKVKSGSTSITPQKTNGSDIDFELIVSSTFDQIISLSKEPIAQQTQNAAAAFDAIAITITPNPFPPNLPTLTDVVNGVINTLNAVGQSITQIEYTTNKALNQIKTYRQLCLNLAGNFSSTVQGAQTTPLLSTYLDRTESGIRQLSTSTNQQYSYTAQKYVVQSTMTVAQISQTIKIPVADILSMNTELTNTVIVPIGTVIYYVKTSTNY